jgi:hypothetical protein
MILNLETLGEAANCFTVRKVPKVRQYLGDRSDIDIFTQVKNNNFAVIDFNTETGDARILGSNKQVHNMKDVEFALVVAPDKVEKLIGILKKTGIAQEAFVELPQKQRPWYKRVLSRY